MENVMELIDRYVNAVGKHLPRKTRADIQTEIRSTLEDMLADRSEKTGQPVDEAMVKDLLREYGAPDKIAATYLPESYVIGPRLFPLFWLVVRIVFAVLTVLTIVGLGFGFISGTASVQSIAGMLGKAIAQYYSMLIMALGNIVLVFAILERVLPESEIKSMNPSEGEKWDPDQLMQEPTGDEVKLWEPIVVILFMVLGLVIFNFYPQIIGIITNPIDRVFIPILSEAFFSYMPWINLLWILGIAQQLVLLRQGRYTPVTRWFDIALRIGGLALAWVMLQGPSLIGMTVNDLTAAGMEATSSGVLVNMVNLAVRFGLVVAIIASTVEIIKDVYRMLTRPNRLTPMISH
jgi:hypothetical protein